MVGSIEEIEDEHYGAQATRVEPHPDLPYDPEGGNDPRLVVIGGADRGREFQLHPGENAIGRGLENDVVLADIAISRRHTLVTHQGTRFVMTDLGSGNGTLVNGERIDTHLLCSGDQIELGNTMLRFVGGVSSLAMQGDAATHVGGVVVEVPTAAEIDIGAPAPRTERRRKRVGRPLKLLFVGGVVVVVFLGAAVLLKANLGRIRGLWGRRGASPTASTPTSSSEASVHFERGRRFLRARVWDSARDEFEKVYALAPQFEHAKRYIRQAKLELHAEQSLLQAKLDLQQAAFANARAKIAEIPSTSVYMAEVPKLKQQIDAAQLDVLVKEARAQRERGDNAQARETVAEALRIAPTNNEAQQLHDELAEAALASEKAALVAAKSVPRRRPGRMRVGAAPRSTQSGSESKLPLAGQANASSTPAARAIAKRAQEAALVLYGKKDWAGAANTLSKQAEAIESEPLQKQLSDQAKAMRRVGQAYESAIATQARSPAQAIRFYQTALGEDQKASGGVHRKELEQRLFKVARVQAITSLSTGHDSAAYDAFKLATRYGAKDSQLVSVQQALEKKAMELFTKGYTIRTRDAEEAQRIWQRVLRMVPPESTAYQKAYKWLNNSTPDQMDEDEY